MWNIDDKHRNTNTNNKDHPVGQLTTYPPSTVLACQRDGITWPECRRHEGQRQEHPTRSWKPLGLDLEYVFLLISFHSIKIIIMRKRARSREGRRQFPEYSDEKGQKSVAGAPRRPPAWDKRRLAGGKRKQQLEKVFQQNPPSVAPTSLSSHSFRFLSQSWHPTFPLYDVLNQTNKIFSENLWLSISTDSMIPCVLPTTRFMPKISFHLLTNMQPKKD